MQTQLVITESGVSCASTSDTPPSGGILVSRNRKRYAISLSPDASSAALVGLLATVRATKGPIDLTVGADHLNFTSSQDFCVEIMKRALSSIESTEGSPFSSHLEIANPSLLSAEGTPAPLLTLCNFSYIGMDTPSALSALNQMDIDDLCLVGLNRAMRYCVLKMPPEVAWPSITPHANRPIEEALDDVTALWFTALFEAALAIRKPLYHHGTIHIDHSRHIIFQRILFPIAPRGVRPINFRIASAAHTQHPEIVIM